MAKTPASGRASSSTTWRTSSTELPSIMSAKGPVFVCLKVSHGEELPEVYIGDTAGAMLRLADKLREE